MGLTSAKQTVYIKNRQKKKVSLCDSLPHLRSLSLPSLCFFFSLSLHSPPFSSFLSYSQFLQQYLSALVYFIRCQTLPTLFSLTLMLFFSLSPSPPVFFSFLTQFLTQYIILCSCLSTVSPFLLFLSIFLESHSNVIYFFLYFCFPIFFFLI